MRYSLFLLLFALLFSCRTESTEGPPYPPADALATFELPDGFQIELFAAEPLIADPVAMEVDEDGRVWVVEMHGYPLDVSGSGKVKVLKDNDRDGWPDEAVTFAEGLVLPTGIMRWGKGVIVTDAPDVLYLEDTDGDDKADIREVLLTGFARSNPQHNLNTPRFELDNWIYLGHEGTISTSHYAEEFGDRGGEVYFPDQADAPTLPRNANGRSVRFQVDPPRVEMLSGETQFGYTFDPWGHLINTSNYYYIYHEVLPARYLARNPDFLIDDPHQFMPAGGPGTTVFPITRDPQHQLLTDAGVITSGCGINWYKGGLFPPEYDDVAFVAEPVHNLIHTDIIEPKGATFSARPQFEQREFLASTDSWSRPVNIYTGPDGALYVIDYYRKIIEHPEWMSDEVNASGQLYDGMDRGRIYRITPSGTGPPDFVDKLDLGIADPETLLAHLASPNSWYRRHAQRLLVHGKMEKSIPGLHEMAREGTSGLGRLHALWTLQGLGALEARDLKPALAGENAGLRENAIRLGEPFLPENTELLAAVQGLAADDDPKVRFQVLLTLSGMDDAGSQKASREIILRDLSDPWVRRAAFTSPHPLRLGELLPLLAKADPAEALPFLEDLAEMTGRRANAREITALLDRIRSMQDRDPALAAALTRGLDRSVGESGFPVLTWLEKNPLQLFPEGKSSALRRANLALYDRAGFFDGDNPAIRRLGELAVTEAMDPQNETDYRIDGVSMAGKAFGREASTWLLPMIKPETETGLQLAVLEAIEPYANPEICDALLEHWPSLTPELRSRAIDLFMREDPLRLVLLAAVEEGTVLQEQIGWRRSVPLLNADDEEVRAKARQVLQGNESGRRPDEAQFARILRLEGHADKGKQVFRQACSECHQVNGKDGMAIGPDLASVRNRTPQAILRDVVEPNASLADGYELWSLERKDGDRLSGVIISESSSSITLRDLTGKDKQVPRGDIADLQAQPYSAMPEGLTAQLGEADLADLLAFLSGR